MDAEEPTVDEVLREMAGRQHALVDREGLRGLVGEEALRRRWKSTDWVALSKRVMRLAGAPVTDEQQALAGVLDAGFGAVVSYRSAAALWDLPGFEVCPIVVSRVRSGRSRPTLLAVVRHCAELPEDHRSVRRLVPVTTLARTTADLIATEHPKRAERSLQAALRMGLTWAALDAVAQVTLRPGRPGAGSYRLLRAQHFGQAVTGSGLECRFLQILRDAGLPEPRRQVELGDGRWIGRVDFLYDDARLVIEVDGRYWHDGAMDADRDRRRNAELVGCGFTVLPIAERLILDSPCEVERLVRSALSRPSTPTVSPKTGAIRRESVTPTSAGRAPAAAAAAAPGPAVVGVGVGEPAAVMGVRGGRRRLCSSGPGGVGSGQPGAGGAGRGSGPARRPGRAGRG